MIRTLRRFPPFSLALAAAATLVASTALFAQTDVTTARISGTVRAASDRTVLPGVTITAVNQDTGLSRTAFSDRDGFYQMINLPSGRYTITASVPGFRAGVAENVRLDLGTSPSIDFSLQVEGVTASVSVTADIPTVEVTNTAVATTMQTEQVKNLPLNGRNFTQLVNLTPESKTESQRGYLQISGERGINSNVTVDGSDYNDAFFGGPVGSAEGRAPLSLSEESIKEFSVITNGASVEFGRSGGGFVNVITKSGTNAFHGSGFFYWQPQELVANFANGQEPAEQDKKQYGGSFGGPVVKDQLFFFASYDGQKQHVAQTINPTVLNQDIFDAYPVLASPDQYVQSRDGWVLFGRADWQITGSNHLMGRANYAKYDGENGTNSSPNDTIQHNGIEGMKSLSAVGTWSGIFGPTALNDMTFNYKTEDIPRADKSLDLPEIQVGTARYGEVSFLPIVSTAKRYQIADTFSYLLSNHVLKGGVDYNDTSIDQIFKGNWRGVFVFNNNADLLAGRYFQYRQFGGVGGLTADEAGTASFSQKEFAGFVQDQWFVTPRLTVTAGLRYEYLNNPNDPILNPSAPNANGSFPLNGQIPDAKNQWSPRLAVSWSPDAKTAVRLAMGRYWSRTPGILFAQLFTANGLRGVQYTSRTNTEGKDPTDPNCKLANGSSCYDPLAPPWGSLWVPEGVERIDLSGIPAGAAGLPVFDIDPNYKNPHDDRITFGFEREVLPEIVVALDGTYSKGYNLERLLDANRVYDGTISANGVPHYSSARPNSFYSTITQYVSDGYSRYYAVALSINKRFSRNFSANASVTYSKDRDSDSNERNFSGIQAEDFNDLGTSWAWADRDQRWRASTNAVWQTPWWGIGLSGSLRFTTGLPYTPRTNFDFNNDGQSGTDRPTLGCTAVGSTGIDCSTGDHLGRNSFRQPSFYSLDLRFQKAFHIGPGDLSFAMDCFNCTNTGNKFVSQTTFGRVPRRDPDGPIIETPNAGFDVANNPGTPRTLQVSARFDF